LGIINPIEEIIAKTRKNTNAYIVIDGAQSAPHFILMFRKWIVTFFVFSDIKCMLRWEQDFIRKTGDS
jgi:cysteine desulfurase/selenocysteine lyase